MIRFAWRNLAPVILSSSLALSPNCLGFLKVPLGPSNQRFKDILVILKYDGR